jgi:hypothetical protein
MSDIDKVIDILTQLKEENKIITIEDLDIELHAFNEETKKDHKITIRIAMKTHDGNTYKIKNNTFEEDIV